MQINLAAPAKTVKATVLFFCAILYPNSIPTSSNEEMVIPVDPPMEQHQASEHIFDHPR